MDGKILLGLLTIGIGIISYVLYFFGIFRGRTKPDPYSWLIWGVLASIVFFAQIGSGGGPGAWATAFTAAVCLLIAAIAYARYQGKMKKVDLFSLIGAVVAIAVWRLTADPLWAVILAIIIGAIGFIPTFYKIFSRPAEETAATYSLNALKFGVALFALGSLSPVTWLYPAALVVMNVSLAATILLRRM
ncbi:MAG: hypothetical protein A2855_01310 [Candidatus Liptonbacteria bacterium RIFCSPHIGHO2_01_FULL_57_28]|uniref:Uncharacterized protein n=1 Tax=Candidatus Liptonbacteria bacterium RIFCSPHIGHO2_01_FULL_57_28 TaxID=1798647 RepID=A0A1G2CBU1_9BACT|nr:MAG: hypothetical protein A2855_01310 [Candidatus Liptonbacteria bacterium RIFCSPHIGHO2_01_FULL_57_28]